MNRPTVAFISTGGTMASLGASALDLHNYGVSSLDPAAEQTRARVLSAKEIIDNSPVEYLIAEILPYDYRSVPGPVICVRDWIALADLCGQLQSRHPQLSGIVIGHGTATMEETAYFLNLTLDVEVPVVLVGSQRPASALSSDAGLNLINAIRVACSSDARGLGVLVVLNDEIHTARDVAKTSTNRLQAFQSPGLGPIGDVDGNAVVIFRRPVKPHYPGTRFVLPNHSDLPRVDISHAYAGADGTAVRAFLGAGASGIISAGFAPGFAPPAEVEALKEAVQNGVVVVQCSHAGSGRVVHTAQLKTLGFLVADDLSPKKARILLMLALSVTQDASEISQILGEY